jgi:hypothetical protein
VLQDQFDRDARRSDHRLADACRRITDGALSICCAGAATAVSLVTWFPNMRPGGVTGLARQADDIATDHGALGGRWPSG